MAIVIFHNPNCSKSGAALQLIRDAGQDPVVVPYMKTGWTKPQLQALFAVADLDARDVLRTARGQAKELGLLEEGVSEEAILDAMVAHPELVERPIVCSPRGVRLCRPPELVGELLGD
ncbi:arsenate reductase (glutaredoxin) [Mameliella sediminis]|uniref:arsenate reductase (glutaredoxin) n=1 Tax=Mameliella sediminis TaxID=2836866 RepID=UPI001C45BF5A|nr:arsenate reductase (glutaredoxin) [Mameliella sediminis]MBV7396633.1 arsenate reductase (glutaredoxin) [Mameliella sediminis]